MTSSSSNIRLLMLHGFAQNESVFEAKIKFLLGRLRKHLSEAYEVSPETIEFCIPPAPLLLKLPGLDYLSETDDLDPEPRAWWDGLNVTSKYEGIHQSFQVLQSIVQSAGPFTGVVGFSQGASLAAMFASWCESGIVPGRFEALQAVADRDLSLSLVTQPPPQPPLEFLLLFSGYRATEEYYHGFYKPQIATPTIHVVGLLDTMVSPGQSDNFRGSCFDAVVIYHDGSHFIPRYKATINNIMLSLSDIVGSGRAVLSLVQASVSNYEWWR